MITRVLVAHRQAFLADALAAILGGTAGVEVVGVCRSGAQAAEQVLGLRPDVLVVGPLADAEPWDLVAADGGPAVVMIADEDGPNDLLRAMEAGVSGYLTTACSAGQFLDTVRRVAEGEVVVLGVGARRAGDGAGREDPQEAAPGLTRREREVLRLICTGRSNAQIATELFISQHTVRTHVQNIRNKMNVRSKLEAALAVVKGGVVNGSEGEARRDQGAIVA